MNTKNKHYIKILVITLSILPFVSCIKTSYPLAEKGIIDLSEFDFTDHEIINLNGEWEFYWNKFYSSDFFRNNSTKIKRQYVNVPGEWNKYKIDGKKLNEYGFATFRLVILINSKYRKIGIKIPDMGTAYSLYINGRKICSNGKTGKSKDEMIPQYLPVIDFIDIDNNIIEIIVHVSNFVYPGGGMWRPIKIGTCKQIERRREIELVIAMISFGGLFLIGIFQLFLFLKRRKEKEFLFFSLYCFSMALRVLLTGEFFLFSLFPGFNWYLGLKLGFLTIYITLPLFFWFIYYLFQVKVFNKIIRNTSMILGIFFSLIVIFTPSTFYPRTTLVYQVIIILTSLFIIFVIINALITGKKGAACALTGSCILFIFVVNDVLDSRGLISTGQYTPLGLFFFSIMYTLLLTFKVSDIIKKNEKLTRDFNNIQLRYYLVRKEFYQANHFSEKQIQICETLIDSELLLTTGELAQKLNICKRTAENHLLRLYNKLRKNGYIIKRKPDLIKLLKGEKNIEMKDFLNNDINV